VRSKEATTPVALLRPEQARRRSARRVARSPLAPEIGSRSVLDD
jgi:hypothetical protein